MFDIYYDEHARPEYRDCKSTLQWTLPLLHRFLITLGTELRDTKLWLSGVQREMKVNDGLSW